MGDHGGARKGAGRKRRLTTLQSKWLKDRYEALMQERAKERALRRNLPEVKIGDDLAVAGHNELRTYHGQLRKRRRAISALEGVMRKAEDDKRKAEARGKKAEAIKWAQKIRKAAEDISEHWKEAEEVRSIAAELIDGKRFVRVGSGRGPARPDEPSAEEIRAIVASEANDRFGRADITPRMVQSACALKLTDEELMARWLAENSDDLENCKK
jgi:hypothetical protein